MGNEETPSPFGIDYSRFSNLTKLLRITAWGNQFYQKLKIKSTKEKQINPHGPALNANEIETAKMMWMKYIQKCNFSGVIEAIKTGKRVPFGEQLGLWMDENGIVRCKGRLINANLEHDATFPILLPKKNWFTTLVIQSYHANLYHSGTAHTLSQIRHEFWIPSGRSEVLRVLRSCGICKRFEGGPYRPPKMPALPKERVSESPPFTRTGLDYLGPLYVKTGGQEEKKVWISLFTCMVTRAVHLELVENLTAEHFLMALRRFIARRGKPDFIISDNAKQFKLTKSAIDQLWKEVKQHEAIASYVSQMGIKWVFLPERAPWMGGFYERLVQSVKRALRKSIQNVCLTTVQLETVIIEIESMLNTRPLTYVSSDIKDGQTLTPAHFLTLNPKVGIPTMEADDQFDPTYVDRISSKEALLRSWSKRERHLQAFWNTWKNDYLLNLRERMQVELKHPKLSVNQHPNVGDVVHVRNESSRGSWPLAKVIQLNRSTDGEIRSAKVQLPSGTILTRAIIHLYPMELVQREEYQSKISKNTTTITEETDEVASGTPPGQTENIRAERKAAKSAKQKLKSMIEELESDEESTPVSRPRNAPRRRSQLNPNAAFMVLCLLQALINPADGLQPLLCEKGSTKITLNLTGPPPCKANPQDEDKGKIYEAKIEIHKRNIAKYDSTAYKCWKEKTIVEAYTNFAVAGWDKRERNEIVPVSEADCWSMVQTRRCREGPLLGGETAAFTENKVEPPYTSGDAWNCCQWYSKEVTNCFITKGKVYQAYHGHMESNLANVANCHYERESCTLHDQSMLVWKVNRTAKCEFVPWKTLEGKTWDNQFLTNDYELAFTWRKDPSQVELCDQNRAIMTDQGIPVVITLGSVVSYTGLSRQKRENGANEASDAIAPQLEALELRLNFFFKESLNQAFHSVCRTIREIQQMNMLLAHSEPTLIARKVLNDSNVMGRLQGTILEVWPCNPIESYKFLSMDERCTEWIPLNYTARGHEAVGFMEPKTRIIYAHSAPAECDLVQETYMPDERGKVWTYSAHSGELHQQENSISRRNH